MIQAHRPLKKPREREIERERGREHVHNVILHQTVTKYSFIYHTLPDSVTFE